MTYTDIYRFPLRNNYHRVNDTNYNFVFQFEPQFENGKYKEGWLQFEQTIIDILNGENLMVSFGEAFVHDEGRISCGATHVITIRGWGNLTGSGAHRLSSEEAANVQDTFAEFIVNRLNLFI
jgi:hypothetical protein